MELCCHRVGLCSLNLHLICLYSCSLKRCLRYHRLSGVCRPGVTHYPRYRQSALRASVFHCKYYKDLGKTRFKSNIFSFVLGTTFQPTIFPPQIQPKQFLDTTGWLFQQPHEWMSRCLPELQTWRWWMCIRTMLRWGIALMGTCQQSGLWEHCVSKILSALGFDQTSVCCWLYRLQKGSQACPITASNPLKTILHFFNSFLKAQLSCQQNVTVLSVNFSKIHS